jgi:hypothetical protein
MNRHTLLAGAAGRQAALAVLAANRMVWWLMLAVWLVVVAAGTYLDRVHLRGAGALSLAVTGALGLAYVLSHGARGRGLHRLLGIAANALLGVELAVYFARRIAVSDARLVGGTLVALAVLGLPLLVLIVARPEED